MSIDIDAAVPACFGMQSDRREAVFLRRVQTDSLATTAAATAAAARLHDALPAMSTAVLEYRDQAQLRDALLKSLAGRAGVPAKTA